MICRNLENFFVTFIPEVTGARSVIITVNIRDNEPIVPQLLEINIPLRVGDKYDSFGIYLLNDDTGDKMAVIRNNCQGDAEKITRAILTAWLRGGGISVSW